MNNGNLKPWKKGQSGNPAGKKKGTKSIKKTLKKLLNQEIDLANPLKLDAGGNPVNELAPLMNHLCNAQIVQAINGDTRAFEAIVNRLEGMPDQKITQHGKLKVDNRLSMQQLKDSLKKKQAIDRKASGSKGNPA